MDAHPADLRQYPKLSPCIKFVLITRGGRSAAGRSAAFSAGFFSTLAVFIEPVNRLEECLHREVMEEVGVRLDH